MSLIQELDHLDLINIQQIEICKDEDPIRLNDTSAGEYQMIMSLLGLYSKIQSSSLILIDEPEISLHPNWQMRYIHLLKEMFHEFGTCHFIIASHSHFMVSDLENSSSSVIALRKQDGNIFSESLIETNTYGWSAEQVLLEVFNTPTTRNYYVADKIGEILELISQKDKNRLLISQKVKTLIDLNVMNLPKNDPLNSVWNKIKESYG